MSTTQDSRGRHRQAARNLAVAVTVAGLTGTGAAMAADGGTAPPSKKAAADGGKPVQSERRPAGPLAENEPIVIQARAALARLVTDGSIEQAEANVVMQGVIAGRVDEAALVRAEDVSAAHMSTIREALIEVKRDNEPAAGPKTAVDGAAESVKDGAKTGTARGPLAGNEPVVIQARAALARLVADGAIEQAEAEAVMRGVIAGRVDGEALVRAGEVASAHMPVINDALREVKRANAPDDATAQRPAT